jgi:hypothetical protein
MPTAHYSYFRAFAARLRMIQSIDLSNWYIDLLVRGQALLYGHCCEIKPQESCGVVVQDVALLFGTEEIR